MYSMVTMCRHEFVYATRIRAYFVLSIRSTDFTLKTGPVRTLPLWRGGAAILVSQGIDLLRLTMKIAVSLGWRGRWMIAERIAILGTLWRWWACHWNLTIRGFWTSQVDCGVLHFPEYTRNEPCTTEPSFLFSAVRVGIRHLGAIFILIIIEYMFLRFSKGHTSHFTGLRA